MLLRLEQSHMPVSRSDFDREVYDQDYVYINLNRLLGSFEYGALWHGETDPPPPSCFSLANQRRWRLGCFWFNFEEKSGKIKNKRLTSIRSIAIFSQNERIDLNGSIRGVRSTIFGDDSGNAYGKHCVPILFPFPEWPFWYAQRWLRFEVTIFPAKKANSIFLPSLLGGH